MRTERVCKAGTLTLAAATAAPAARAAPAAPASVVALERLAVGLAQKPDLVAQLGWAGIAK